MRKQNQKAQFSSGPVIPNTQIAYKKLLTSVSSKPRPLGEIKSLSTGYQYYINNYISFLFMCISLQKFFTKKC